MGVGTPKGRDTKQNIRRNVGFPHLVVQEPAGDETFWSSSAISANQNACNQLLARPGRRFDMIMGGEYIICHPSSQPAYRLCSPLNTLCNDLRDRVPKSN